MIDGGDNGEYNEVRNNSRTRFNTRFKIIIIIIRLKEKLDNIFK